MVFRRLREGFRRLLRREREPLRREEIKRALLEETAGILQEHFKGRPNELRKALERAGEHPLLENYVDEIVKEYNAEKSSRRDFLLSAVGASAAGVALTALVGPVGLLLAGIGGGVFGGMGLSSHRRIKKMEARGELFRRMVEARARRLAAHVLMTMWAAEGIERPRVAEKGETTPLPSTPSIEEKVHEILKREKTKRELIEMAKKTGVQSINVAGEEVPVEALSAAPPEQVEKLLQEKVTPAAPSKQAPKQEKKEVKPVKVRKMTVGEFLRTLGGRLPENPYQYVALEDVLQEVKETLEELKDGYERIGDTKRVVLVNKLLRRLEEDPFHLKNGMLSKLRRSFDWGVSGALWRIQLGRRSEISKRIKEEVRRVLEQGTESEEDALWKLGAWVAGVLSEHAEEVHPISTMPSTIGSKEQALLEALNVLERNGLKELPIAGNRITVNALRAILQNTAMNARLRALQKKIVQELIATIRKEQRKNPELAKILEKLEKL